MTLPFDSNTSGLMSDGLFNSLLELELRRSRRYQYFTSLLMIEASVQLLDRLGKTERDSLHKVATLLRKELRETDIVGLRGDRIVTVLLPYSDRPSSRNVAARLSGWVSDLLAGVGEKVEAQIRVGGASFPSDATDLEGLYQRAGEMLNQASFQGNGAIQILD